MVSPHGPRPLVLPGQAEGSDGQRASEGSKGSCPKHSYSAFHHGACGSGSLVNWGPGTAPHKEVHTLVNGFLAPSLLSLSLSHKYVGFPSYPKSLRGTDCFPEPESPGCTRWEDTSAGDAHVASCCLSEPTGTHTDRVATSLGQHSRSRRVRELGPGSGTF